ncbi:MAG: DUF188 domain-containing protein [Treponema sp.]|nr:DUF188 domain-containing protein [Treponema sp.]
MKILVDADSCPRSTREVVLRAVRRTGVGAFFVANRPIPGITGDGVMMELCSIRAGAADDRMVALACPGDVAITRDIPLAYRLVEGSIWVIDDRGRVYTQENIREHYSRRNFMFGLAEKGLIGERIRTYGRRELKAFADSLDRILSQRIRENPVASHQAST